MTVSKLTIRLWRAHLWRTSWSDWWKMVKDVGGLCDRCGAPTEVRRAKHHDGADMEFYFCSRDGWTRPVPYGLPVTQLTTDLAYSPRVPATTVNGSPTRGSLREPNA